MTIQRWENGTVAPRPTNAIAYHALLAALEEAFS
jgi:hypothetical protein